MCIENRESSRHGIRMERMQVEIVSIFERNGHYCARARALAQDAEIMVEVRFRADEGVSDTELWLEALDPGWS